MSLQTEKIEMLPVHDRVRNHTAPYVNERIDLETRGRLAFYEQQSTASIQRRLTELDFEWDIDRAVMANFAIAGGAAFTGGIAGRKRLFYLFAVQMGFLLLHAVKGWCPPVVVFRRLGFRTQHEIQKEREGLFRILQTRQQGAASSAA